MFSLLLLLTVLTCHADPTPPAVLTCQDPSLKSAPFCNAELPIGERVRDLMPRISAAQRIAQMGMVGPAIPSLAMEQYNFGGEVRESREPVWTQQWPQESLLPHTQQHHRGSIVFVHIAPLTHPQ